MTVPIVELVCPARPPSVNNRSTKVRSLFEAAIAAEWSGVSDLPRTEPLHGLVVWFVRGYRIGTDPDADNISKGVWDTLKRVNAFDDDKQVRLRTALIVDLEASDFEFLDLTSLSERAGRVVERLVDRPPAMERGHVTYIRFGTLDPEIVGDALSLGTRRS